MSTGPKEAKHRLKRKDLVTKVFYLLSEVYEQSDRDSIWDIELPIERIREHLSTKYGVCYSSDQWVYTQLRRYEEEIGARLFRKICRTGSRRSFSLAVHDKMVEFDQKQHLHVGDKIKVANGVYDKIHNASAELDRPVRLLLGAGSTVYHLARIIADRSWEDETRYAIHTHNLGSLQTLLGHNVNYERIAVSIMSGTIDPVTYTIVGADPSEVGGAEFDYIIQGTSCVHEGRLYIESHAERDIKQAILHRCRGTKVLVLTKHEFLDRPLPHIEPYGRLQDYQYLVVPRSSSEEIRKKQYDLRFEGYLQLLAPEILNWNYSIYRVAGTSGSPPAPTPAGSTPEPAPPGQRGPYPPA
jgi:DeoR/GlpR family transcriptional regulator of sugar metabolism